ncbi:MAG: heavy-metal-associated domain-containing protein [Bradymonadaceae bacterium]
MEKRTHALAALALALAATGCDSGGSSAPKPSKAQAETPTPANENSRNEQKTAPGGAKKSKTPAEDSSKNLASVELSVEEMVCGGCSKAVKSTLTDVSGVSKVSASHKKDRATVTYDPKKVSPQTFVDTLSSATMQGKEMGWKVEVVETPKEKENP